MDREISVLKGPIVFGHATLVKCEMTARNALTEMLDQDQRMAYDTTSLMKVVLCAIEELTGSRPDRPDVKMGDSSSLPGGLG